MRRALLLVALLALPRLASAQSGETIEYYGTDAIGSIRIVWDANGHVLGRQDYAPFGKALFPIPAMPKEGFVGNEQDAETDQGNFHARMFEAGTGRFTRPDPLWTDGTDPQQWNRYAYARNNPIAFTDNMGLALGGPCGHTPEGLPIYCGGTDGSNPGGSGGSDPGCSTPDCSQPPPCGTFPCQPPGGSGCQPTITASDCGGGDGNGDGGSTTGGDTTGGDPQTPGPSPTPKPKPKPKPNPKPNSPRINCTHTGFSALIPDYMNYQLSGGALFGITIHLSLDRYGNAYFGIGPSIGKATPISSSVTFGYLYSERTQAHTIDVMTAHGVNVGGGVGLGGGLSFNSSGLATEVGFFTPQLGAGYSYSWMVGGVGSQCQ